MAQELTRRGFLGAGALTAASALAAGALSGCSPASSSNNSAGADVGDQAVRASNAQWSFEIPPALITDEEITETITTDVVVVGAGISGIPAAAKAAEMGASVQVIEKQNTICSTRPTGFSSFGSQLLKDQGVMCTEEEKDDLIRDIWGGQNATGKQELLRLWTDRSGEFTDWLVPIVEKAGVKVTVGGFYGYYAHIDSLEEAQAAMRENPRMIKDSYWNFYPVQHQFGSSPKTGVAMWASASDADWLTPVYQYAMDQGAAFEFETTAVQLVREDGWEDDPTKRVIAVIATDANGDYVKYEATQGVILATGGFDWDDEMLEAYYPIGLRMARTWQTWFTGDGHKMALWVGAKMDDQFNSHTMGTAATAQVMTGSMVMPPEVEVHVTPWGEWNLPSTAMAPCLWVNNNGQRFINEETGYFMSSTRIDAQPDHMYWGVWDSEWKTKVTPHYMDRLMDGNDSDERMAANVEAGMAIQADTIEELAEKMGLVHAEDLKTTISNYNAMVAAGKDTEYLKPQKYLSTVDKAPYYAAQMGSSWMTTVGGVEIDADLHVLDEKLNLIPGLYAGGNPAGGFYGNIYAPQIPMSLSGHSMTFSWVAAENVVSGV